MAQHLDPAPSSTQALGSASTQSVRRRGDVSAPINRHLSEAMAAPVMEAQRWRAERRVDPETPLLDLAQAAPSDAPPLALRQAMADAALSGASAHLYGPVLGDDALRGAIAETWSSAYGGAIDAENVAVTAGCNQAFCVAVATFAGSGDAVLLPTPWYFNHKMWLDMSGVRADPLPVDMTAGGLPNVEAARARLTPQTKAIVLVSPNNPTGAEYPATLIEAFYDLAEEAGVGLIVDKTYRDYHSGRGADETGAPHGLFRRAAWDERFVHLYSFSKVFRLTGHRTGAMIAGPKRLALAEKFFDTMTICAPRLGQAAALAGLRGLSEPSVLGDWFAEDRRELFRRRAAVEEACAALPAGWRLIAVGAYFAYLEHPFEAPSTTVAKQLLNDQAVLSLPGEMFGPRLSEGGDGWAEKTLRLAFANLDADGLRSAIGRLGAFTL